MKANDGSYADAGFAPSVLKPHQLKCESNSQAAKKEKAFEPNLLRSTHFQF